ncbi:hypothetical protein PV416_37950 [Streptomyces ipomoeae]|nr:hypothetical protein [Streptomyces ipomoeae]MDX2826704.1 hypothetical protein [Streptomyces ipomoeae]MDX2879429.1 hypothetical protein [Streptomyces ipomoeae]
MIHIRRARRARIAADIDRELPGLGEAERRQGLAGRLREHAAAEAEGFVWRREQALAEQDRRDDARLRHECVIAGAPSGWTQITSTSRARVFTTRWPPPHRRKQS